MLAHEDRETAMKATLLAAAPPDAANAIVDSAKAVAIPRGTMIFAHGEEAHSFFVVLSGWVKLFRISPNGAEAVVGVFTKGQSFAEAVAIRKDNFPVSAEAVTDCRLLQVRAGAVLELMRSQPDVCLATLAATFKHLHELVGQIEQLKAQNGAQRVAEFLLDLAPVDDGACTVTLPYEKVLIAGRLGLKPESLSRVFSRLRGAGVKVAQNHAAIADVGRLRAYAAEDPAMSWSKAQ